MNQFNKLSPFVRSNAPAGKLATTVNHLAKSLLQFSTARMPFHQPVIDRRVGTLAASGLMKLPASNKYTHAGRIHGSKSVMNIVRSGANAGLLQNASSKSVKPAPALSLVSASDTLTAANKLPLQPAQNPTENKGFGFNGEDRRGTQNDRRNFTSKTLWLCLTSPRRCTGRRKSDRRFPLHDVFDQTAMFLAICLMTLSLTDAFLTLNIIARGGSEVNPVMNYMLQFGTFMFVASKMLMTAIPLTALIAAGNYLLFKTIRVRTVTAILIGLYGGLIMYELLILSLQ